MAYQKKPKKPLPQSEQENPKNTGVGDAPHQTDIPAPKPTRIQRDEKGRLLKGSANLNPGGRPQGLASFVRSITDDNRDQARFFAKLANGGVKGAQVRDLVEAHKWLADRGSGKALDVSATLTMNADPQTSEVRELATETLLSFVQTLDVKPLPEAQRSLEAKTEVVDAEVVSVQDPEIPET